MEVKQEVTQEAAEPSEDRYVKSVKRKKRLRVGIAAGVVILVLLTASSLVSHDKFDTFNPFTGWIGFIRIMTTDVDYVQIQSSPKIILTQPDHAWNKQLERMEADGYTHLEKEQMGSSHVFEKDGIKVWVHFSVNGFYGKCTWSSNY